MTADDTTAGDVDATTAGRDAAPGRRPLLRIGARTLIAWIARVVTPRRRTLAAIVLLAVTVAATMPLRALFLRTDDSVGDETALAAVLGLAVGALAVAVLLTIWMVRASRRLPSAAGDHPRWRDAALIDRAVDPAGRVTLAPGTAERVAVEARRAIAAAAIGVPAATLLVLAILGLIPAWLLQGEASVQMLLTPAYLFLGLSGLWTAARTAGRMALLRDAADAELALPESERTQAPPVVPPHGSRLP
ncbi:hypothetical protein [Clavibacter zhangzhiyongii]|uniref:hypothetical protein n=1 Tax=Clavibacter zhangzhiyongii TaxID=2768071 RepID=UPI00195949C2|nr:hypothetical protein [Clavibacter zhangzhiyongii]MBM7026414.1 hypothetical protein [Clavibacter zhangzhiyongii]